MKNTFYRPEKIDTNLFDEIMKEMRGDLVKLISQKVDKEGTISCVEKLIQEAKPLDKNPEMVFWGFAEPESMPSDSRVAYFYTPSYIAVSILAFIKLYGPEEAKNLKGFNDTLRRGLMGATGRSFSGAGRNGLSGMIKCFDLFVNAKMHLFIDAYPEICPTFTSLFFKTKSYFKELASKDNEKNSYGEDYKEEIKSILEKMDDMENEAVIFVYGTLLKGNRNYDFFLKQSKYLGEAVLSGYGLYNLGTYPGIKKKANGFVRGEIYCINAETFKRINQLEDEGNLYSLEEVTVKIDGKKMEYVGAYTYLHQVDEKNYVYPNEQPWKSEGKEKDHLVWYVAYGSNMLYERFMCYINGGSFRGNGRSHKPCENTSLPRERKAHELLHNMYYANESGSWDNGGVSFLDVSNHGHAYGVAYLITEEQLNHIWREENGGFIPGKNSNWYNNKAQIGIIEGIPAKTITNLRVLTENKSSRKYKQVLMEGLRENYPSLDEELIREYVDTRNKDFGRKSSY